MLKEIVSNPLYLGLLIVISIGILSFLVYLLFFQQKKTGRKKIVLDNDYFNKVIEAINLENILSISNNNERIIVEIKNASLVKSNFFVEEKLGAFVSKGELKFILKDNAKEFTEYVKGKIK